MRVETGYSPRSQFVEFHQRTQRFAALVCHRRAGKTVACLNDLVDAALRCNKPQPRFAYLAPFFAQAKDVAFDYLCRYTAPIPGCDANISELRIDLPNGGRVRLYGAENADRLRGLYLDGVVVDEPADIDPRVWPEIIRPALADREGWAAFIGTPKGHNAFYDLWEAAKRDPSWFTLMLRASETGIIAPAELEAARAAMTIDQFEQEFECSFEAAIIGAYYAEQFRFLEANKRIGNVPWDPMLPVHTAWDLGIGDSTAIWFAQQVGPEVRIIDYYEASGEGMGHYANLIKSKPYTFGDHILPHDAEARMQDELGKTRVEILASLGIKTRVLANSNVDDGINAARVLLPRCWFNAEKCARGIEALKQYRREYDEARKAFRSKPRHDWTSHAADAWRYMAVGLPSDSKPKAKALPKQNKGWVV